MLIVRPIMDGDLSAFISLAKKAGPGFTSLAVGEDVLQVRLKKSVSSFTGSPDLTPDHIYILLLEDSLTGEILGMSAIKAQIGIRDPFFNFRIMKVGQKSTVMNRRYDMEVLMMVNEYNGATEVGSLYLLPKMRGTGAGRLISQSRYMLIAADRARFSNLVISELRGHVDENGYSPFWEAIGRKFFHMDFMQADNVSAEQDSQFILDLMPRYPIYAALLPEEARAVMGKTHPAGIGARRFLEAEGFRYNGMIDIFDGGPSVSAPTEQIRTIRDSRLLKTKLAKVKSKTLALISNDQVTDFRAIMTNIDCKGEIAYLEAAAFSALGVKPGENVRVWIKQ